MFDYTKKGYITNKDIEVINRLSKLSRNTLTKLVQLRNINVTKLQGDNVIRRLKKSDFIYILLKSKEDSKQKKYLELLNNESDNDIHNKINKIRIEILELDKRLSKKDKKEYVRELYDILDDKLRKTSITRAEKKNS